MVLMVLTELQGWRFPSPHRSSLHPFQGSAVPRDPPSATWPLSLPTVAPCDGPSCCQAVAAYFQALLVPGEGECEERSPVHPVCSCLATRRLRIDLAWPGPAAPRGRGVWEPPATFLCGIMDLKKKNGFR